jgi:hypothetical protein
MCCGKVLEGITDNDLSNINLKRNASNVPSSYFNCGGWALQTFNWYHPWENYNFYYDLIESSSEDILEYLNSSKIYDDRIFKIKDPRLAYMTNTILSEINSGIHLINNLSEIRDGEFAVAFRTTVEDIDFDFHFMKRESKNHWSEKLGASRIYEIFKDDEYILDGDDDWPLGYSGEIILFAKTKLF